MPPRALRVVWLMAFIAGFVDALGFVLLDGVFTAHVTGNFVLIGAELAGRPEGIATKLLTLPAFAVGALGEALLPPAAATAERRAMLLQFVLLALFFAGGLAFAPFAAGDSWQIMLTAALGAAAMGVQNASARRHFTQFPPSTVMTGNVTQAMMDVSLLYRGHPDAEARATAVARARRLGTILLAFVLGACAGGLGARSVAFWALLCPLLLVALAMLVPSALAPPAPVRGRQD